MPKYINPAAFAPVPSQKSLASVDVVSYFCHVGVYGSNYFLVPVYNVALGPATACPVVLGFPCHFLSDLKLTF